MSTQYARLPEHMQEAARLYIEEGEMPGDFLKAVLCNNLVEAFGRADELNRLSLWHWAQWLYNDVPQDAWGSVEKMRAYAAKRRTALAQARSSVAGQIAEAGKCDG